MGMAPAGHGRSEEQLLEAWESRCRAEGAAHHCGGAEASSLVRALDSALRVGTHTPELGRAARNWGSRFATPVEALSACLQLRDVLASAFVEAAGSRAASAPALGWVFDQVNMEVVDAASANLRSVARIDALTGCANRRALDEELVHTLAHARRSGLDVALAALDLDGLKVINDTKGHPAGDAALVSLVEALRGALRKADTLYRTGGDEFVVVAPFTDEVGARSLMQRAGHMGGPSFSWGVASTASGSSPGWDGPLEVEAAALLAAADADLYARRRARRREQIRARRKRRAAVVASVAASATVTSGAVWAATLSGAPSGLSAQRSNIGPPGQRSARAYADGPLKLHDGAPMDTGSAVSAAKAPARATGSSGQPMVSSVTTSTAPSPRTPGPVTTTNPVVPSVSVVSVVRSDTPLPSSGPPSPAPPVVPHVTPEVPPPPPPAPDGPPTPNGPPTPKGPPPRGDGHGRGPDAGSTLAGPLVRESSAPGQGHHGPPETRPVHGHGPGQGPGNGQGHGHGPGH